MPFKLLSKKHTPYRYGTDTGTATKDPHYPALRHTVVLLHMHVKIKLCCHTESLDIGPTECYSQTR